MTVSPKPALAAGLLLLSGVLGACAASSTPSVTDGQSHWLQECNSSAECGPLDCICGVCTLECSKAADCEGALGNDVACVVTSKVDEAQCAADPGPRVCTPKDAQDPTKPDGGSEGGDGGGEPGDGGGDGGGAPLAVNDGDGMCGKDETPENAPSDCEQADDGLCTGNENAWNALADCGTTKLVSVHANGNGLTNVMEFTSVSDDGSRAAFVTRSASSEDDNNTFDAYVLDLARNELILATPRVLGGTPGGNVEAVELSGDGQWLAFEVNSTNFALDDTNSRRDVYATHLDSGEIIRVSFRADGSQSTRNCDLRGVTRDSRYVGFTCLGDLGAFDLQAREVVDPAGLRFGPRFDATGNLQASSWDSALVPEDTNGRVDVYLQDHTDDSWERVSVRPDGIEGNNDSFHSSMSLDGRLVAFQSRASNLTPDDTNDGYDVFVHDRVSGENLRLGAGVGDVYGGSQISGNGRFVAFSSYANLTDDDRDGLSDIYLVNIGDWVDSLPPAD